MKQTYQYIVEIKAEEQVKHLRKLKTVKSITLQKKHTYIVITRGKYLKNTQNVKIISIQDPSKTPEPKTKIKNNPKKEKKKSIIDYLKIGLTITGIAVSILL